MKIKLTEKILAALLAAMLIFSSLLSLVGCNANEEPDNGENNENAEGGNGGDSSEGGDGVAELADYIRETLKNGKTAAFAGASGVGKSTLMNALFPTLTLATAEISRKIERGRHTTRHVEIFDIENSADTGFLADTPGFSLIDFARFDFFTLDELLPTFREFSDYIGKCRYADCAHVGESADECAVARAVEEGKIPATRLESYRSIWRVLKEKSTY